MHTFTDTDGREWTVPEIKLQQIMKLGAETNIELDDLIREGHLWNSGHQALICCGTVLWNLCRGQHEVDEEAFFNAFDGEVFDTAQDALATRVADFTPPHRRKALLNMVAAMREHSTMLLEATEDQIKLQSQLNKALEASPESAAEIRGLLKDVLERQARRELATQEALATAS